MGVYSRFRNPSVEAQTHYVKVIIAMSTRKQVPIGSLDWWSKVSSRVSNEIKRDIFSSLDFTKLSSYNIERLRCIMFGCSELETALTLMM
jgi:predicted phosphohydrolase